MLEYTLLGFPGQGVDDVENKGKTFVLKDGLHPPQIAEESPLFLEVMEREIFVGTSNMG